MVRDKLDTFTKAYVECALWSSTDPDTEQPFDKNYDVTDIDDATLEKMVDDCRDFRKANAELLEEAGLDDERAGHDFWLTRNRHGAGFWDRGLGAVGEKLSEACRPYGECDLYVGDDGAIYGS